MEKNVNTESEVYEIGFHLVPTIAEENLSSEVSKIRASAESLGGAFISEEFPKMRPLAYTLSKKVGPTKTDFDRAYFGWIKYELTPDKTAEFKATIDANNHVLRYLIISTTRETPVTYSKLEAHKLAEKEAEDKPVSAEDLDKSIDKLVTE